MDKIFRLKTFSWGFRNVFSRCGQQLRWSSSAKQSTIKSRLDFFNSKASNWWDLSPKGSMSYLLLSDPHRIQFVCDQLRSRGLTATGDQPLTGLDIVDIGCGAGVLTEKFAKLGANMTGLDPVESVIEAAKRHAESDPDIKTRLEYLVSTPEEHSRSFKGKYDVALVFLVLEHIQNRNYFINSCLKLLKPNGSLFILHGNQTLLNGFLHCFWVPYVLRAYDKNLIKYHRLIPTADTLDILKSANWRVVATQGIRFNWVGGGIRLTKSDKYGIMMHVLKCLN